MGAFIGSARDDLFRRQADAFIGDVHAAVASAEGDLFGAVRVAVQTGLADQEFQPPAKALANGIDGLADRLKPFGAVRGALRHARRATIFAMDLAHDLRPFAGGGTRLGGGDRERHHVLPLLRGFAQRDEGGLDGRLVAGLPPGVKPGNLVLLDCRIDDHDAAIARRQRRGFALLPTVDADDDGFIGLDPVQTGGVRFDQPRLHVFDRGDGAAHLVQRLQLGAGAGFQFLDLGGDGGVAVEKIAIFQKVGLIGDDLLHAQRPLLVPGARQAQRLVPGWQLHGAGAGVFR